jgi:hypothetical protein
MIYIKAPKKIILTQINSICISTHSVYCGCEQQHVWPFWGIGNLPFIFESEISKLKKNIQIINGFNNAISKIQKKTFSLNTLGQSWSRLYGFKIAYAIGAITTKVVNSNPAHYVIKFPPPIKLSATI